MRFSKKILSTFLSLVLIGTMTTSASLSASADTSIDNLPHGVLYSTHVQKIGWQPFVYGGQLAGTVGKGLRIEAIKIKAGDAAPNISFTYQVYVQGIGWQEPVSDGAIAGTEGQNKRIEAIRITTTGAYGTGLYEIKYKVQMQTYGWTAWQSTRTGTAIADAAIVGMPGKGKRIEAIEID